MRFEEISTQDLILRHHKAVETVAAFAGETIIVSGVHKVESDDIKYFRK